MIFWAFLLILAATVQMTNVKNDAKADDEILEFGRKDSIIIFICMIFSLLLSFIAKRFFKEFYMLILAISSGVFLMILIIVNRSREQNIKKKHERIIKVFEALQDIMGAFKPEEIDFSDVPFEIEEDKKTGLINKILIDTSIGKCKVNDNTVIQAQYSINKFFPELQWISEVDYPKRELTFTGLPKPPQIARWPGSDYRPTGWIPLGLSGQGEIGWNIADPKDLGSSSYIDEDGHVPGLVKVPSAPQCMTLGSPLSLDTIIPTTKGYKTMGTINIQDIVFDINNKPSKVLGMSKIQNPDKIFKIFLSYKGKSMIIKSDEIHKFPIIIRNKKSIQTAKWIFDNLCLYNDNNNNTIEIIGNNFNWKVEKILICDGEPVRCILIDSETHLFLITDKKEENWNSGNRYNFDACGTSNTGGGKSIWIDQPITVLKK